MFHTASEYFIRLNILILCTTPYFSNAGTVTWIEHIPGNSTRYRRQANCGPSTFHCGSGECIDEGRQCDGKDNCLDGSDENDCKNSPCPPRYLFKCNYGACISRLLVCDGKPDCKDNSDETVTDCKTVSNPVTTAPVGPCGTSKFQCDSGECINDSYLCDGKVNCADYSDETEKHCSHWRCPRFTTYQCRYGACVSKDARCNNVVDCFDGSDEESCNNVTHTKGVTTTPSPPIPPRIGPILPGYCTMPHDPANGVYTIGNTEPGTFKPGSYLTPYSPLRTLCRQGYKPNPPDKPVSLCYNGMWGSGPSKCSLSCQGVKSTKTTKVTCSFKRRPLDTCNDPVEGTIASISCESLHEESSVIDYPYRKCRDGSWDRPFSQCYPMCGVKRPKGRPNVLNGIDAVKGDYPWHIGIYDFHTKKHLCGGSILNERVVLSAAHCFTDLSTGAIHPKENYIIAAGKYYRVYNDSRDEFAQYSTVNDIHVPSRYKGDVSQYEGDLAVVVLTTKLTLSQVVQPVCLDWTSAFEYQQLSEYNTGVVMGWGYTVEGADPAEVLKELSVPVVPYDRCYEQIPKAFRRFLTHDKVCAGFLGNATAVCQGDSGGGLTFPHVNDRYYIRGIVSISPSSPRGSSCDSNQYATYTLVSKYIDFINQYI